jgi:DNA replication and repair protein RecF
MFLKKIQLINFRLHKNSSLNFSDNLNFIVGGNGQGKTSLLEAVYYLTTTKSLLGLNDFDAINFNKNFFEITGDFEDISKNSVKIFCSKEVSRKKIFLNNKQINKSSELIGKFPVVTLTQADHYITFGAPIERRRFVDASISQASETYLNILLEYNRILRQRSSLLNRMREYFDNSLSDELNAWTESLIRLGTQLVEHRLKFIEEFNEYLKSSFYKIMKDVEKPEIDYSFLGVTNTEDVKKIFYEEISKKRDEEIRRAANLIGPHRDDFIFKINNLELRKFGSQGQHKTFQLALRFAQFFYLKKKLSRTPIFLMDDVFGEVDSFRAKKISEYLKEIGQAFITMTDFTNYDNLIDREKDLLINVRNGVCSYV